MMIGWRIEMDVEFPEGLAPGDRREAAHLFVARDGQQRPVLRGSALAGALKHALEPQTGPDFLLRLFGDAPEAKEDNAKTEDKRSLLVVENLAPATEVAREAAGRSRPMMIERTFHARSRHTGVVIANGLYDTESWAPGSSGRLILWLDPLGFQKDAQLSEQEGRAYVDAILSLLAGELLVGGQAARGMGRMVPGKDRSARVTRYALDDRDGIGRWLDDHLAIRSGGSPSPHAETVLLDPDAGFHPSISMPGRLTILMDLGVPRGQDFLVGDGEGSDADIEPQVVRDASGADLWRLPGSTMRGAFRAWTSRLARREGLPVADSREKFDERVAQGEPPKPDELGCCYDPDRKPDCPVARLFGSLHGAGRIHITDGHAIVREQECSQTRMHVAVDPISGGAVEGLLFDNRVLCDPAAGGKGDRLVFPIKISVVESGDRLIEEREVSWLVKCIAALHKGLIRIGSSRAAGRLEVVGTVRCRGRVADLAAKGLQAAGVPAREEKTL